MLRRVALVRTDVSEERSASFIRVTRIGELGTTPALTSNRRNRPRRNTLQVYIGIDTTFTSSTDVSFPSRVQLFSCFIQLYATLIVTIVLNLILENGGCGVHSSDSGRGSVVRCCEHGTKLVGST
jgi:hypothetical protein